MENFNNLSLASTLRGLYATPIICELSKKKVFERNSKKINLKALKKIKNKFILNLCLDYLEQIQITEKKIYPGFLLITVLKYLKDQILFLCHTLIEK